MLLGLVLKNPDEQNLDAFCTFLIPKIRARAFDFSKIDKRLADFWDTYFREALSRFGVEITVKEIIKEYFSHLSYRRDPVDKSYIIEGDGNLKFPRTDILVDSLAALITYGNLEMPRYPVFDDIYEDIKKQIPILYKIWRMI